MPSRSNSDAIAGAAACVDARLEATIADLFLPDAARLDDRVRLAVRAVLRRLVAGIEGDLRRHAARLLAARGLADAAEAMLADEPVLPSLTEAGLLRDPELIAEVIARTHVDLIAQALPIAAGEDNRPSLLVRLTDLPDSVVAAAARALLAADARRGTGEGILPAELQHRLVWWIAAAIRSAAPPQPASDRALVESARRCLAAHDEGERAEAIAERLVAALDPLPGELPALLVEALGDRRPTLAIALLARALAIDGDVARTLVVEPDGERLWTALRGAGLSRDEIARVALSLAEADPRRDIEALADRLDELAAMPVAAARDAIAPLTMPRDLRDAVRALARGRR